MKRGAELLLSKLTRAIESHKMILSKTQIYGNKVNPSALTIRLLTYLKRQKHLSEIDCGLVNVA